MVWFAFVVSPNFTTSKAESSAFKASLLFTKTLSALGLSQSLNSVILNIVAEEVFASMVFAFCAEVEVTVTNVASNIEELSFPAKVTFISSIALSKAEELSFALRACCKSTFSASNSTSSPFVSKNEFICTLV